jgi:release factor H-coupled RctB family protein
LSKFKGRVICNDPNLLFEEAPESYQNIDTVIQGLIDLGLLKAVAALKPILAYKG